MTRPIALPILQEVACSTENGTHLYCSMLQAFEMSTCFCHLNVKKKLLTDSLQGRKKEII